MEVAGGSSNPQPYTIDNPDDSFKVLDKVLEILCPNITHLQFKKIDSLTQKSEDSHWEYYGNHDDYDIYGIG